nr:ORF125 [Acipenserid herpesvirus 1]
MACSCMSNQTPAAESAQVVKDFLLHGHESSHYLDHLATQVALHRHKTIPIPNLTHHRLRIGNLDDTIYHNRPDELEAWESFYTPDITKMTVLGAFDNFASLAVGLQLIILAGKDGNVYAYENEVLHLVAENLADLFTVGLTFPGIKTFDYGALFEPMVILKLLF